MMPMYEQDGITIYHGRCEDVLPMLPASSVDLVLVDPPYGRTQLAWDVPLDWPSVWPLVYRVCKPTALQVVFSQQPFTTDLITSNRARFRYELVWPKPMPTGFLDANRRPLRAHESVLVFAQRFGGRTYNAQKIPSGMRKVTRAPEAAAHYNKVTKRNATDTYYERHPTSVLPAFSNGHGGSSDHETAKPLQLIEWLVLTYSNAGETVLDFTAGSGTTGEACKRLGRRCVLVEQEAEYVEVAVDRLRQSVMDLSEAAR